MKISILQWNILYQEKAENIIKLLREIRPDIACLQELAVNSQWNRYEDVHTVIAKKLNLSCFFRLAQPEPNDRGQRSGIGNGIFSRFPIASRYWQYIQKPRKVNVGDDNFSNRGRVYLETTYRIQGKTVTVGTTHTSYVRRFINNAQKKVEADNLIRCVKRQYKNFVFTGDLNSRPRSYTVSVLKKHLKHCGPDINEKTFANKEFVEGSFRTSHLTLRLDYVFVTPDVRVISSKIVKTKYSDHLPILTTIEL